MGRGKGLTHGRGCTWSEAKVDRPADKKTFNPSKKFRRGCYQSLNTSPVTNCMVRRSIGGWGALAGAAIVVNGGFCRVHRLFRRNFMDLVEFYRILVENLNHLWVAFSGAVYEQTDKLINEWKEQNLSNFLRWPKFHKRAKLIYYLLIEINYWS